MNVVNQKSSGTNKKMSVVSTFLSDVSTFLSDVSMFFSDVSTFLSDVGIFISDVSTFFSVVSTFLFIVGKIKYVFIILINIYHKKIGVMFTYKFIFIQITKKTLKTIFTTCLPNYCITKLLTFKRGTLGTKKSLQLKAVGFLNLITKQILFER